MAERWVSSAVRITSKTARVDEITAVLELEPTQAHERGTLASPRNPNGMRRDRMVWILDSDVSEEAKLEDHLRWAVGIGSEIRARSSDLPPDWEGQLLIGWTPKEHQDSVLLDRGLVEALGDLGFDIHLTAYSLDSESS